MAILYPLALPAATKFRTVNWREVDITSDVASPFTGQSQVIDWGGRWFACTLTLIAMREADAAVWSGWLTKLFGNVGTFLLGYAPRATPLGSARTTPGTPLVNGASQTGNELAVDGLPHSAAGYLKAGDFFQLGNAGTARLYKLLDDVDTSSGGAATFSFWPALRASPADNAAVVVSGAKGVFHRISPVTDWTVGPDGIVQQRSFDAKERLS